MSADYLENQVLTASPYRLHLLTVDGAIRFARLAIQHHEAARWSDMHEALNRSRACVAELISGVRTETAPEIGVRMKQLFAFVYRSLALADPERSREKILDAVGVLQTHRETWLEVGLKLAQEQSAKQSAAPVPATVATSGVASSARTSSESDAVELTGRSWLT